MLRKIFRRGAADAAKVDENAPVEVAELPAAEVAAERERIDESVERTRGTWFNKISNLFSRGRPIDDDLFDELEELLIQADLGVETTEYLIEHLRFRIQDERIRTAEDAKKALQEDMIGILEEPEEEKRETRQGAIPTPYVILVVGVNGTGKTTSIAKLANYYRRQNLRVILAAGDTFRAAAIDQLKIWGDRLGIDVIAHQPDADPAAVVYDAMQAAQSRHADILIIDTAGRLQTKYNLMEELKKLRRVLAKTDPTAPHEVLLVMDATTGQNGLSQAKYFLDAVGVTGIVLTKLDGTAKGGATFAIVESLSIPILYVGTGEKINDFAMFQPRAFVEALFQQRAS